MAPPKFWGCGFTGFFFADWNLSSTELESGNAIGAFLKTPAPVLGLISGPMGAQLLSSTGLGSSNLIGRTQFPPTPALDKNRFPISSFCERISLLLPFLSKNFKGSAQKKPLIVQRCPPPYC